MAVLEQSTQKEVQIVVFKIGKELFASDIHNVKEIRRVDDITPVPYAPDFVEGIINLRGQIYPIIDLRKRFKKDKHKLTGESRIVLIDLEKSQYGMIVDAVTEVVRVKEMDIDKTPELLARSGRFLEGVIKSENQLILLVDVEKILTDGEIEEMQQTEGL